jgi:hypothetical protein
LRHDIWFLHSIGGVSLSEACFRDALLAPLTATEMQKALSQCAKCSAPGADGLPFEFWMNIMDVVSEPFAEACMNMDCAQQDGTKEWPVLLGTILHKQGPKNLLENYRLVSVLDSDLRWREKVMLMRISDVVQRIISDQQTAFLKGRQLCDNAMAFMLALEDARIKKTGAIILALDQEKAYDRVEWTWLFRTLTQMAFPENFIISIKQLYTSPIVRVLVNKFLTHSIKYQCGVLQGDPLSVLLYILTIQCLLDALKSANISIHIEWEGRVATLYPKAHADDLIAFVSSHDAYGKLQEILTTYCSASNAVMHPAKAIAFLKSGETYWHADVREKGADQTKDHVHLGCPFRVDGDPPGTFLSSLLAKFSGLCVAWSLNGRPLSRRVEAVNSYVLSGIWHSTQLCPLPDDFADEVRRVLIGPVFKAPRALIQFDHTCYPKRLGGLGLLHPGYMMQAMNGRCVARMISGTDEVAEAFKLSFMRILEETGGCCFFKLFGPGFVRTKSLKLPVDSGSPFWGRIYDTMIGLKISYSEDWDDYTDEEILMLPFDLPVLIGKETCKLFGPRVRPSLFPLRIFLFRDLLTFSRNRRPRFQLFRWIDRNY